MGNGKIKKVKLVGNFCMDDDCSDEDMRQINEEVDRILSLLGDGEPIEAMRGDNIYRLKNRLAIKRQNEIKQEKLKMGRAFIEEHKDEIASIGLIYNNIGIAVGVMDISGNGTGYIADTAVCSAGDMKRGLWSNRIARGIIGQKLKKEYDSTGAGRPQFITNKKSTKEDMVVSVLLLQLAKSVSVYHEYARDIWDIINNQGGVGKLETFSLMKNRKKDTE